LIEPGVSEIVIKLITFFLCIKSQIMHKKILQISLFLIVIFLISCKKDPGVNANGGGTAFFTFAGAPSSCATPVIAGTYSAGTPMTFANTLTFTVNVSVKGTYNIRTTSVNGVWFSGSGTFPVTGDQTIVLTGNGTPARAGNFTYVPAMNNTCNFNVSFSAGGPSAVFTYIGAPGNCTAPVINGVYSSGIALGSGNYVDLAVNVTTAGAYTVSTNSANGISFSGSGTFTAVGAQVIRLIGNGTPTAQGVFTYIPGGNGCSFSITVAPPAPPATFTYNGGTGNCITPVINGTYTAGIALNGTNSVVLGVNVSVIGSYSVTTNNSNGVVFSGSGIFTATGANTITLTSTNTGTAGGTFSYTPTGGCSFDITYTSGPPPPADFLKCTIDGVTKDFNTNMGVIFMPGIFSATGEAGSSEFTVSIIDNNGDPITIGSYSKATLTSMTRYCAPSYLPDISNPLGSWQTFPLNGNTFTVTIQTITPTKVTGIFSGDLFDFMGANKKVVTNGSFSVTY
jgi:hypothetical protein